MAFTLQWPNTTSERILSQLRRTMLECKYEYMATGYKERLKFVSPALCVQADVLYPNAWAGVRNINVEKGLTPEDACVHGCKGNLLDNEFPFQSRIPVTLPLLQYPSNTRGTSADDQDMCARPVLNWEKYIREFESSAKVSIGKTTKFSRPGTNKRRQRRKGKLNTPIATEEPVDSNDLLGLTDQRQLNEESPDEQEQIPGPSMQSRNCLFVSHQPEDLEDQGHTNNDVETEIPEHSTEIEELKEGNKSKDPGPRKYLKQKKTRYERTYKGGMTSYQVRRAIYHNPKDPEVHEKDETIRKSKDNIEQPPNLKNISLDIRMQERSDPQKVSLATLRKYKNQPDLKVMGTWNFLYGGNGACDWMIDSEDANKRNVLVGNGRKLRMAKLRPGKSFSMLSHVVDSVWEEDQVQTNIHPNCPEKNDLLSDLIFKIVTPRRKGFNYASVQRGRSVEIYRVEGNPTLLTSIPNICYGTKTYAGGPKSSNPLIISFDANPYDLSEIVTLDDNHILRFANFVAGKTVTQLRALSVSRRQKNVGRLSMKFGKHIPQIKLNESSGVVYAHHPSTYYQWHDSDIYFFDRRENLDTSHTELLSLRSGASSFAWSDQQYFLKERVLNEYVSTVKSSHDSTYYYVGTSSRILLMDMRVPGNPVLKMSHGMKSAACYIDLLKDENYEVLVAGSQRIPEIFCAVNDFSHISCLNRPGCNARNPILQSYPSHLSNSMDFFEFVHKEGGGLSWSSDYERAKDHCYAWTTGLRIMPGTHTSDTRKPPGFIVLNSNSFGDVFYQELDQKPLEVSRETEGNSLKLRKFTSNWTKAMTPTSFTTFCRPTQNKFQSVDCTTLVEPNAEAVKRLTLNDKEFDPFTPHPLVYGRVNKGLKTVDEQVQLLRRKYSGSHVDLLLRVWSDVEGEEESDVQLQGDYGNEDDASRYQMVLLDTIKEEEEIEESEIEKGEVVGGMQMVEGGDHDLDPWSECLATPHFTQSQDMFATDPDNYRNENPEEVETVQPTSQNVISVQDENYGTIVSYPSEAQSSNAGQSGQHLVVDRPYDYYDEEAAENAMVVEENIRVLSGRTKLEETPEEYDPLMDYLRLHPDAQTQFQPQPESMEQDQSFVVPHPDEFQGTVYHEDIQDEDNDETHMDWGPDNEEYIQWKRTRESR